MLEVFTVRECFITHGDHAQRELIKSHIKDPRLMAVCEILCSSAEPVSVQRWAHEALAQIPGRRAGVLTQLGLGSTHMTVRLHTMVGIAHAGIGARIDWLFPLLSDESGGIRLNALEILICHRPRKVRAYFGVLRNDPKAYIRDKVKKIEQISKF